jgi:hypothetical protein
MINNSKSAKDYEEIKPLVDLCKAGNLFEVQAWIAAGKPVNLPILREKGIRRKSPLQYAVDKGIHSLVQILLDGGAVIDNGYYNALAQAVNDNRLDLIKLLVEHGADINSVGVFDSWDPAIMEYFIERGADVETSDPLAEALCSKMRTALGIFRRYKNRFASFQEQINIALRYHCREGDLKWASLLLWAGADPLAKGPDYPDVDPDAEEDMCALEYAIRYNHFEIFNLKKIRITPELPIASDLLRNACMASNANFLIELIKKGFKPAAQQDSGSDLIQTCIQYLEWPRDYPWWTRNHDYSIDASGSRETIKTIHILAKHGAKWIPADRNAINDVRSSFLKMSADYIVEFVWIMSLYQGCSRESIEQLLRTSAIRRHAVKYKSRIEGLLKNFSSDQVSIHSGDESTT